MTDRELLEAAAKAAGKNAASDGVIYAGFVSREWNPLTDDGDALRLACAIAIKHELLFKIGIAPLLAKAYAHAGDISAREHWLGNIETATRRAIVRAAAAMVEPVKVNASKCPHKSGGVCGKDGPCLSPHCGG